ncbi:MAG TPA: Crp/Fnr family transcriptional regulator [Longimicrobium sp.]|nr:Crp/Fnr family transcriptional regulator [Longimicrobium sp.]
MRYRNRILAALPAPDRERLRPVLEPVDLEFREVLVDPHRPIGHVWFPEEGVVSILGVMEDGAAVETATVGNEGMAGIPVFLGAESMAAQAFVQVPGRGYRMTAAALREEVRRGGALFELLGRYTQALFTLTGQTSACNRLHPVDQRCARWLLMTHDRVEGDTFELTHLFLSQMLGVRRATVTEVAGELQARGLIEYARGTVTVVDRAGLEAASCECYQVVASEFARLLGGPRVPSPLEGVAVSEDGKSTAREDAPREG